MKYLKIKLETFSLFRCESYMTKNNLYAKYIAVETQEYSSHVISGSKLHAAHVSQMV